MTHLPKIECVEQIDAETKCAAQQAGCTHASDRLIVWDHRRSPGCSDSRIATPPRPPWVAFDNASHYPNRHGRGMNALYYDGHAAFVLPATFRVQNFREPGSLPPVPGYPGE